MTAAIVEVPAALVRRAVAEAERQFKSATRMDVDVVLQRHITIHSLSAAGVSVKEISGVVGISERNVKKARKRPLPEDLPRLPAPEEIPVDRAAELAKLAEVATGLAFRLRDEDPRVVQRALSMLRRETLEQLTIVALAGLNVDAELSEIYSWVLDLPAAQEEQP